MHNVKKQLSLGYCPSGAPSGKNGPTGPFRSLFPSCRNLRYADSLKEVDAVVLWGGEDISPSIYKEEPLHTTASKEPSKRDIFEWHVLKTAFQDGKPVIGVCRGAQLACIFSGGHLIQDVYGHRCAHGIKWGDTLYDAVTAEHHQMMFPYYLAAKSYDVFAESSIKRSTYYKSPDENVVSIMTSTTKPKPEPEGIYFHETQSLCVQWHPEWAYNEETPINLRLMEEIKQRFKLWS